MWRLILPEMGDKRSLQLTHPPPTSKRNLNTKTSTQQIRIYKTRWPQKGGQTARAKAWKVSKARRGLKHPEEASRQGGNKKREGTFYEKIPKLSCVFSVANSFHYIKEGYIWRAIFFTVQRFYASEWGLQLFETCCGTAKIVFFTLRRVIAWFVALSLQGRRFSRYLTL